MTETRKQYWGYEEEVNFARGFDLEGRAVIALGLIQHFAIVAARENGVASGSGRTNWLLQTPDEVVSRAFRIADAFVDEAERRGEIRGITVPIEEKAKRNGELGALQTEARWPRAAAAGAGAGSSSSNTKGEG